MSNTKCIMPECPYCPCCPHGREVLSAADAEYSMMHGDIGGTDPEWVCDLQ